MENAFDVIVIGAGMAGLKAAHDLHHAGKSVVILEARDRIGGRIHTDRTFSAVPIELGAEFIHGDGAETWALVRTGDIRTITADRLRVRLKDGRWRNAERLISDWDESQFSDDPAEGETVAQYLARMNIPRDAMPFELRLLEIDSESIDRFGAVEILVDDDIDAITEDVDYRVIGGYDQLYEQLAHDLDIRLRQVVEHIEWTPSNVKMTTTDNQTHIAQQVILTLPLGVLQARQVKFTPDLPDAKWAAVDSIGICDIVKLHFTFDKRVFPRRFDALMHEGGIPPYWWDASRGYRGFKGQVVVGWAAGDAARHLISIGEEQALADALAELRQLLADPDLTPVKARMMQWNDEPFTQGAYTFNPPGSGKARGILAQPLQNTLFFAGEATDEWHGYVQGAYRSGARAAKEALTP